MRSVAIACVGLGCTGIIGGGDEEAEGPSAQTLSELGVTGLRRLTASEYDASVRDLAGVSVDSELVLPEDLRTPFDNDYELQQASEALITAADSLAAKVAGQVVIDPALRGAIVPCTPAGAEDTACFREFVAQFGRRVFRRALTQEELDRFMRFVDHGKQAGDFWTAVDSALRAFFQHPAFLYRLEIGTPVSGEPGVVRLTDHEMATRLSYTLWGSTPPVWLLDLADKGALSNGDGVRAAVEQMMLDDKAKRRMERFHAMWMGYERLPHGASLAESMQLETGALINKVVFVDNAPWVAMLRSTQTYINDELALHYGLPLPPGGEGWVDYGDSNGGSASRQGLLSHGSFLSAAAKFDDTSPTQRGLLIRTRLFCQSFSTPPPELLVNTDEPPQAPDPDACKKESYNMWQTDGCKLCHQSFEPVGFGLENFDMAGRYRTHEIDRPECVIDGAGTIDGQAFSGPIELSNLMIDSGGVDECVATMMYRFTMGRYELVAKDRRMVDRLVPAAQREGGLHLYDLVVEMLSSEAFRHRREEAVQ